MLTGNTKNERPEGNDDFVRSNVARPKDLTFKYDDDAV